MGRIVNICWNSVAAKDFLALVVGPGPFLQRDEWKYENPLSPGLHTYAPI
jgi:hypothetical protein